MCGPSIQNQQQLDPQEPIYSDPVSSKTSFDDKKRFKKGLPIATSIILRRQRMIHDSWPPHDKNDLVLNTGIYEKSIEYHFHVNKYLFAIYKIRDK